jgi:hypothetical protein
MKFATKKNPTVLAGFFFRAKFHSNSLYVVEKKIVGISQYPYFSLEIENWWTEIEAETQVTKIQN